MINLFVKINFIIKINKIKKFQNIEKNFFEYFLIYFTFLQNNWFLQSILFYFKFKLNVNKICYAKLNNLKAYKEFKFRKIN